MIHNDCQNKWYAIVEGEQLHQGDLIDSCPVLIPPASLGTDVSDEIEASLVKYSVVVLSHSCDLEQRKLDFVLVCPVFPLSDFGEKFKGSGAKEGLRRGYQPAYHLLNTCCLQGFKKEYLVVNFRSVYSVPFEVLTRRAKESGKRLRLLSPYREHLSQAFARFFMRVGLPSDIPSFSKKVQY